MDTVVSLFEQHGLLALFVSILVEQLGAPVPAMPFLLLAGVAASSNSVFAAEALAVATLASMLANSLWFYAGRRLGRRVLSLLCRISISQDNCVRQSELNFTRRGAATLVVAKFIPGLSIMAAPLAGAIGMGATSFVAYNLAGIFLWAGSGIAVGLLFHDQVLDLLRHLSDLGSVAMALVACLFGLYVSVRAWRRWRVARSVANFPRIGPDELAGLIVQKKKLLILDVRAAVTRTSLAEHIPGARHVELAGIGSLALDGPSRTAQIVTYCACPNDSSALKAAQLLSRRGFVASVLRGGIDGWADAGYLFEPGSG